MARTINSVRIVNAKLISKNVNFFGKRWAIQDNADGYSVVDVTVPPMPNDIKEYLEGNDDITIFACASNIDKLCEYALTSFPNIEDLYLFKTSAIVVLEDDLSYLLNLNKIYVPIDLLSSYISAYPTLSSKFDTIVEDYTLTIPFIGETTLTSEYVDSVIAMLSSAEKNAITKVVISNDFNNNVNRDVILSASNISSLINLDTNNDIYYGQIGYRLIDYVTLGASTIISTGITGTYQMIYKYTVKFSSGYNGILFYKTGENSNGIGFKNVYGNPKAMYWQLEGQFATNQANKKVQFIYNGDKTFTCNIENDTYTLDFTDKQSVVSGGVTFGRQPSSIYEMTIIENNVSIYNLVPIYDVANEIYCFYESVSKTLLTNVDFTSGGNDA